MRSTVMLKTLARDTTLMLRTLSRETGLPRGRIIEQLVASAYRAWFENKVKGVLRNNATSCMECGEQEDYHLHRPASGCGGCMAPRDHHRYVAWWEHQP